LLYGCDPIAPFRTNTHKQYAKIVVPTPVVINKPQVYIEEDIRRKITSAILVSSSFFYFYSVGQAVE
jgi:hypothetical protein